MQQGAGRRVQNYLAIIARGRRAFIRFAWVLSAVALIFPISAALISCEDAHTEPAVLTLHPFERLATRNGSKVAVLRNGKPIGELSDKTPTLPISGESELTFTYVGANGETTDVVWSQTVTSKDETIVVVQPWRRPALKQDWHVLAWARPKDLRGLKHIPRELSVISPIWWTLDEQGQLRSYASSDLAVALRKDGVALWPAVHGLDADGLHTMLANDARRSQIAATIASEAKMYGAQGVNIDIEGYRLEDSDSLVAFVQKLAALVHAWGGVVSYDVVARSDTWETLPPELTYWSNAPKRRELAAAVDFMILMAYDQFNHHRPAGPVAAPNWVEDVLAYLLRYADPQSVLLGIPAYGLIWDPVALGAPRAVSLTELKGPRHAAVYDETHLVCRIVLSDGRFYWAEKELSETRTAVAFKYSLAGLAIWRLGLDYPELWRAIRTSEQEQHSLLGTLKKLVFGWAPVANYRSCS